MLLNMDISIYKELIIPFVLFLVAECRKKYKCMCKFVRSDPSVRRVLTRAAEVRFIIGVGIFLFITAFKLAKRSSLLSSGYGGRFP
jgi:hypothetical protein